MTLTSGYKELMFLFKLQFGDGDPWGTTMGNWFAVADILYHANEEIPAEWDYHHSPVCDGTENDWPQEEIRELFSQGTVTTDDLFSFARVVTRYENLLRMAGRDY